MKKCFLLVLVAIHFCSQVSGQRPKNLNLDAVAEKFAINSFDEFYELHHLPNDAHFPADIEKNVLWCEAAFAKRGFTTQRLKTATVPLLLAERKTTAKQVGGKTPITALDSMGYPDPI